MEDEMVIVSDGGKKVNALYKGMTIKTDQLPESGGEGSAPEPFMLFLASIGTCAGINVYVFCQKRNIPYEDIRVIQKNLPKENGKGVGKIILSIELPATFPEKYHSAIIRAANLCAVKRHVIDPPEFEVLIK